MKKESFKSSSFLGKTRELISWSEMNENVRISANEASRFLAIDVNKIKQAAEYLHLTFTGEGRQRRWDLSLYDILKLHVFLYSVSKGDNLETAKKKALVGIEKRKHLMDYFSRYELAIEVPDYIFKESKKGEKKEILSKLEKILYFYANLGSSLGWGQKLRTYLYELRDVSNLEEITLQISIRKKRKIADVDNQFEEVIENTQMNK